MEVTYEPGAALPGPTPPIDYRWLGVLPGNSEPALRAEVFASPDLSGPPVVTEILARSLARWGGSPAPGVAAGNFSARVSGEFVADHSGAWEFGLSPRLVERGPREILVGASSRGIRLTSRIDR